jgi:hypothetical protein
MLSRPHLIELWPAIAPDAVIIPQQRSKAKKVHSQIGVIVFWKGEAPAEPLSLVASDHQEDYSGIAMVLSRPCLMAR